MSSPQEGSGVVTRRRHILWLGQLLSDGPVVTLRVLESFLWSLSLLSGALQSLSVSEFTQKSSVAGKLSSIPRSSDARIPGASRGSSPWQHTDIGGDVVLKFALFLTTGGFSSQCFCRINTVLP